MTSCLRKMFDFGNDRQCENWVVFACGLYEVKQGLQGFVFDVFSKGLSKETSFDIENIKRLHRKTSPAFENMADNAVCDIWTIIKCFLPKIGYRNVPSFEELDVGGLLSLITTCRLFDETVTVDLNNPNIFSEFNAILIQVFYQTSRDITKTELRCYLKKMIELLTNVKTIKNRKEAIEAVRQIAQLQVQCNLFDVKHRPPEKYQVSRTCFKLSYHEESEDCWPYFADTKASDAKTGLSGDEKDFDETDSDLNEEKVRLNAHFGSMTALLKNKSDPEDSRESFQTETWDSKEKTVDEIPIPDGLQAYRAVTGKHDICVRSQDLPEPHGLWVNVGLINLGSKITTEQTEKVKFQTLMEGSNPFEVTCNAFVLLLLSGTEYKTEEATEVTNQPMTKTTEPLVSVPDPELSLQDQPEFDNEMIMYVYNNIQDSMDEPEFDKECTGKPALVETKNQDLKKGERISDKHLGNTGKHLDDTEIHPDDTCKHLDDTDKHLDDTGKHLDDTGKHLYDKGKHLYDTGKHLDDKSKHLDDTGKIKFDKVIPLNDRYKHLDNTDEHLYDTGKHLDDTEKDLDNTGKHLDNTDEHQDDTDKYLADTGKHRNDKDKRLEYTDKDQDDTDKYMNETDKSCSFSSAENAQHLIMSEAEFEDLDGDGLRSLFNIVVMEKVCEGKESTINWHDEDSDGEHHSEDSVEQTLSKRQQSTFVAAISDTVQGRAQTLRQKLKPVILWDDIPLYSTDLHETVYEETLDLIDRVCMMLRKTTRIWRSAFCCVIKEDPFDETEWDEILPIGGFQSEHRWFSSLLEPDTNKLQKEEEKKPSFGDAIRQAVEDRWTRFTGEPEIRVEQSFKKRRGVMFGTVSRQGYLGCSAKKINSKILTAFVFMLLFSLSHAEVKGNRMHEWKEESVAFSGQLYPCDISTKIGHRLPIIVVAENCIEGKISNEERTGAHELCRNYTSNRRAATRKRARPQRQAINSDKITQGITWKGQPGGVQYSVRAQTNGNDYQEETIKLAGAKKQGISSDNTTQRSNWKEQNVESTIRAQRTGLDKQEESQELAAISLRNLEELKTGVGDNFILKVPEYNETAELLKVLLLNDSDVEGDCWISEEEHYWEFQYPTGYTSTKNNFSQPTYNEQCDIGEVYAAILTELCLVVVVAVAYCFISIKGKETYSWVTTACLITFFLLIVTFLMKQFDNDPDTFSGVQVHSKSIFMKRIKCICVALIVLLLLLLMSGLCIIAVRVLHGERCPLKSYQVDRYYEELNQNYDTGIKEGMLCSEQGESDLETAGIRSRNSCRYCEDENEQQLEDCICLLNKLLTITYEDIENERQFLHISNLAEDLYNLNSEKRLNDGKPLTVDENEALVHEFSGIKPFLLPEEGDILNNIDTDQDLEDFEIEENQEKKNDSDSEDDNYIWQQNRECALTEHIDEQVGDCVKKIHRKAPRRESNDGREVQSFSDGCERDIYGAEGFLKKDAFCLFEADDHDVNIVIPSESLGASIPLDNTYIENCSRPSEATGPRKSKSKLRLQVFPNTNQGSRQYSGVNVAVEKKNSKSAFQNLNYKVKRESRSKKNIDSTFTEQDFGKYLEIRGFTWLPLNQLPAPKLDQVSVAFVQNFEPLMAIIDQIANGTPPTPHVSMRYELLRFCTLRSYPKENKPYLIRLAEAGFYYASDSDGVVCYCCGIRRYNWVEKDDPKKVHQRINPDCKFLKKNEEVNVPVKYFGPYSEKLMFIMSIPEAVERPQVSEDVNNDWAPERIRSPAPAQQTSQNEIRTNALGINTAIPKHPTYATKTTREASYNGWADTSSHTPQELSDAGFFYAGFGDCVRCFYCGIGLRHWTKDDNPWIEHARWSRNCVYLRQKKGEEFVNLVQLALQYSQDNDSQANEASGNASASQDVEKILLSNAAQSVLEMGYQPKMIKRAIEEMLLQNRNAKIVAQTLMEKLLEIEETEDAVQTAQAPAAAAEKTTPTQQTAKPKGSLSSEGTKGTCASNTEGNSKKGKDSGSIKAKSQRNDTSESNKGTSNEVEKNDSKSLDPKTIKAENELLKEQTLCKVCLDNTVSIVFLPCGHLVTCADCAPAMRKCPICRALVKGTVRTYMS